MILKCLFCSSELRKFQFSNIISYYCSNYYHCNFDFKNNEVIYYRARFTYNRKSYVLKSIKKFNTTIIYPYAENNFKTSLRIEFIPITVEQINNIHVIFERLIKLTAFT